MTRRPLLLGTCAAAWLAAIVLLAAPPARGQFAPRPDPNAIIGDERTVKSHVDQALIDAGRLGLPQLFAAGKALFEASFTELDGAGRPLTNGTFPPMARERRDGVEAFNRISGPEANSCSGCHNKPRTGGGGDNVSNVFVLGQRFSFFSDPTQPDENGTPAPGTLQAAADERNTLGMFGSGAIEMLAREMSTDLIALREDGLRRAAASGQNVIVPLETKGVHFGELIACPNGMVMTEGVEGVNPDLIIRPFSQKGVVTSLREFTNNAFPQHHGMEPAERFGVNTDPDGDGVANELTVGDITAVTLFQAALAVPGQRLPDKPRLRAAAVHGQQLFTQVGCADCHRPVMLLNSPFYTEPNPFNPPFNLLPKDVSRPFRFDLTREGEAPRLEKSPGGGAIVRCYTDLKRHNLGNDPLINNEKVIQNGVPANVFITKKLWGFASEPPYLHNGCATTIMRATLAHGGEAQASRDAFAALPDADRASVIEFLMSLQTR